MKICHCCIPRHLRRGSFDLGQLLELVAYVCASIGLSPDVDSNLEMVMELKGRDMTEERKIDAEMLYLPLRESQELVTGLLVRETKYK